MKDEYYDEEEQKEDGNEVELEEANEEDGDKVEEEDKKQDKVGVKEEKKGLQGSQYRCRAWPQNTPQGTRTN